MELVRRLRIHFVYIVIFLILALIMVTAYKSYWNADLVKLVEFSATLTSIILAVLAIFITIYYSSGYTGNIDRIDQGVSKLSEVNQEISEATKLIRQKIDCLPGQIEDLGKQLKGLNESMLDLDSTSNDKKLTNANDDRTIEQKLAGTRPPKYLFLLYSIYLAKTKNIPWPIKKLSDNNDNLYYYIMGCLIPLQNVGMVKFKKSNMKLDEWEIGDVNAKFLEAIKSFKDLISSDDRKIIEKVFGNFD